MENEQVEIETTKEIAGKTVLSFSKPTPMWATWVFRTVFLLTTAAMIVISSDTDITDKTKTKIFIYMKALDVVVWGFGRAIGVDKKDFEI